MLAIIFVRNLYHDSLAMKFLKFFSVWLIFVAHILLLWTWVNINHVRSDKFHLFHNFQDFIQLLFCLALLENGKIPKISSYINDCEKVSGVFFYLLSWKLYVCVYNFWTYIKISFNFSNIRSLTTHFVFQKVECSFRVPI